VETKEHYYSDNEFFPTPYELCLSALKTLPGDFEPELVLDPGAGEGIWGDAFRTLYSPYPDLYGLDIRSLDKPTEYDYWAVGDYLSDEFFDNQTYDLIMGNPPYSMAKEFVERSVPLLNDAGYLVFLFRLAFLEGQDRGKNFWPNYIPKYVYVCSKRPSFTGDGRTDTKTAYSIIVWQKGFQGETTLRWLKW